MLSIHRLYDRASSLVRHGDIPVRIAYNLCATHFDAAGINIHCIPIADRISRDMQTQWIRKKAILTLQTMFLTPQIAAAGPESAEHIAIDMTVMKIIIPWYSTI